MAQFEDSTQSLVSAHNTSSAKFKILWTIFDYMKLKEKINHTDAVHQKSYVSAIPGKLDFQLVLYPKGNLNCTVNSTSLFLKTVTKATAFVVFKMALLDAKNNEKFVSSAQEVSEVTIRGNGFRNWLPEDFPVDQELFLPNGSLRILVEGTAWTDRPAMKRKRTEDNDELITYSELSFAAFESDNEHSDATLAVGNETFQVHKNILSRKSSVFKELFQKSKKNIIVVSGVDPSVFRMVLYFIYNNMLTTSDEIMLKDILAFAHKYKMQYLKEVVQIELAAHISVEKSIDYLILAKKHDALELKDKILKFISENKKSVSTQHSEDSLNLLPKDLLVDVLSRVLSQE